MKVFLSWSGQKSQDVASLLDNWLRCVIQAVRPWISTRDIDRGSIWFGEINNQLKDTTVGIICLTKDNKNRPWILFEAGALAKGLSTSRVITLLVDLTPKDIEDPLAQFNHTFPTRESMLGLVKTLNETLDEGALDNRIIEQVFNTYWPQFAQGFKDILESAPETVKNEPRKDTDILEEVLENTRMLGSKMRRIESDIDALKNTSFTSPGMINQSLISDTLPNKSGIAELFKYFTPDGTYPLDLQSNPLAGTNTKNKK